MFHGGWERVGSRMWLSVKTYIYVKVKKLGIISWMTIAKILVLSHGDFFCPYAKCQEATASESEGERLHESILRD